MYDPLDDFAEQERRLSANGDVRAAELGENVRRARERAAIGVRELARRIDVSPSLISRIEKGTVTPSVGTLFALQSALAVPLGQLMGDPETGPTPSTAATAGAASGGGVDPGPPFPPFDHASWRDTDVIQRASKRKGIDLGAGVRWERLTPHADPIEFTYNIYEPGGASCDEASMMRHSGREYGYVVSGTLSVTLAFDTHRLEPGDSIAFDSSTPHRLFNDTDEDVISIWFVVGR